MKIKYYALFIATSLLTIVINFSQTKLVKAGGEYNAIKSVVKEVAPDVGEKGFEYIFSLIPVQIIMGIAVISLIIWGIGSIFEKFFNK